MNQFPYLYPHSLSEAERLNEEELWQDNRDAEVSHTQRCSDIPTPQL